MIRFKEYLERRARRAAFMSVCLAVLAVFGGLFLGSCANEDLGKDNDKNGGDKGAAVSFNVSEAQNDAQKAAAKTMPGMPVTRAAFSEQLGMMNLTPEDLTTQRLSVQGAAGTDLCLIETTTPGVNPMRQDNRTMTARTAATTGKEDTDAATRANITTMTTLGHFTTIGYRGTSATSISNTPWFHDKDTNPDGTLVNTIYWWAAQPFGKFFAIAPREASSYTRLKISPDTYAGTPYVDFEVEPDVKNQKDLMTACSGLVHYDTPNVAPRTDLRFRHALTAVRFKVGQNLSYSKTITKVEIIGAKNKGRYVLPTNGTSTGTWSSLDASTATFTLGGDGTVNVSTQKAVNQLITGVNNNDNYTFYMIPQELTGKGVKVKITFADSSTPIEVELTGRWKPGTTKTYALSQNTSTWDYQLTTTSPAAVAYNIATTGDYTILSYREDPVSHVQQPVKWKIVGYDADGDGTFAISEKPAWLTGLSKTEGDGSTTAMSVESGTATVRTTDIIDSLAVYNQKFQTATSRGTSGAPYDLSMHDFKGNPTAQQNTANSYLISAPGWYKIPLVYGNAIKNGANNTGAYTCSESPYMQRSQYKTRKVWNPYVGKLVDEPYWEEWDLILHHFTVHNDAPITSPYINVQNAADPATQAYIVWSDQSGIVEAASLQVTGSGQNSWLNFHVPADKIKNGNAVVGIKNASGQVLWSWHLWFDYDDALDPIPVTNYNNIIYTFSKHPVGFAWRQWLETTYKQPRSVKARVEQEVGQTGNKQTSDITITQDAGRDRVPSSTLYQWGRKDAFPGVEEVSDGANPVFTLSSDLPLGYAIGHPEQFLEFHNIQDFFMVEQNWYSRIYLNLWSNKRGEGISNHQVIKTIYDPSPVGFKVPPSGAHNGFSRKGHMVTDPADYNVKGGWDVGWHFYNKLSNPDKTVFFPATGTRYHYDGTLHHVKDYGYSWTASNYRANTGWLVPRGMAMSYSHDVVYPGNAGQCANGLPVHPIKDE
ncbi:hypothetical protein Prede_0063 [Prevotella dentalis DSM 3688]|uniref:Uncharacterized protein n=2 Tax=Prevotella dentalis (strain ATCC 49559 / DSM 3688 / JCM 13448 / NCTC 12043 / ES 2772) TaxID=908937 RepID=L0J9D0_PREDD|nr:fimbrillin family protein [Prevotella dentalis]AGB27463.1 hypothetical protein Prede_0063 [Prevotella dentalis DSM 3688]